MARAMKEQAEAGMRSVSTHRTATQARVAEAILSGSVWDFNRQYRSSLTGVSSVGGVMASQESLDEIFTSVDSDLAGLASSP